MENRKSRKIIGTISIEFVKGGGFLSNLSWFFYWCCLVVVVIPPLFHEVFVSYGIINFH